MWVHYSNEIYDLATYYYDDRIIIKVFNQSKLIGRQYKSIAKIFHRDMETTIKIEDENFDVLKFKALLKAIELGWDIKNIKI